MRLKHILKQVCYKFLWYKAMIFHYFTIKKIRKRGYANVVFFASILSMWRYQKLYERLKEDSRFNIYIIIVPFRSFSEDLRKKNVEELKTFFDSKGVDYIDGRKLIEEHVNIRKSINPDILFYPQQYNKIFDNAFDCHHFEDKLLCYYYYAVNCFSEEWSLNTRFQNVAWRLYYDSSLHKKESKRIMANRGRNVVIVGNPNADEFIYTKHKNVWKDQGGTKKKVIWAPHFTIEETQILHRGSFLWLSDVMLNFATEYSDSIQFAFKPHPRLKSILYNYAGWGKEKTDEYYKKWDNLSNCQLEEGLFFDLFMTSDAMIHDCGSFTPEYHYSQNPVLFTTKDIKSIRDSLNEFGKRALDAHYWGKCKKDVQLFLEEVVLKGEDVKMSERIEFYNKYLLPPNGKMVSEITHNNIIESIWGMEQK